MPAQLNIEERNLLSVAYKNVVGARRASWCVCWNSRLLLLLLLLLPPLLLLIECCSHTSAPIAARCAALS